MPDNPEPLPSPSDDDVPFKRMVIVATAASLAIAYAWLAGFVRQPAGGLSFHWRWLMLPWAVAGFLSTIYFWRKVWPKDRPNSSRTDLIKGSLVLVLPALWWLIFPLRSLSGEHFRQVMEGLIAAAAVLTFGALMLIRLGRALERDSNRK